jgi:hypothetical protein
MMLAPMTRLPGIALLALIACTVVVVVIVAWEELVLGYVLLLLPLAAVVGLIMVGPEYLARREFKHRRDSDPPRRD